jgi:hypothetical protein
MSHLHSLSFSIAYTTTQCSIYSYKFWLRFPGWSYSGHRHYHNRVTITRKHIINCHCSYRHSTHTLTLGSCTRASAKKKETSQGRGGRPGLVPETKEEDDQRRTHRAFHSCCDCRGCHRRVTPRAFCREEADQAKSRTKACPSPEITSNSLHQTTI